MFFGFAVVYWCLFVAALVFCNLFFIAPGFPLD